MEIIYLVEIAVVILLVYLFVKFIVSPIIRAIIGVLAFFVLIYLLQRFFGLNLDQILSPFGISSNLNKFGVSNNWISGQINAIINYIKGLAGHILNNIPKQ